jgi:predicted metalloprotease with PDZ domain
MTRVPALALLLLAAAFGLSTETSVRANMAPPVHRFFVGVTLEKGDDGPRIASVTKGQAGDKAGLLVGDVILAVDSRYWKALSDADLKTFAEDEHIWPVDVIIVRDREDVTSFHIEG